MNSDFSCIDLSGSIRMRLVWGDRENTEFTSARNRSDTLSGIGTSFIEDVEGLESGPFPAGEPSWARTVSSCFWSRLTIYSCSCSRATSMSIFSFCSLDSLRLRVFVIISSSSSSLVRRSSFSFLSMVMRLRSLLVRASSSVSIDDCFTAFDIISKINFICRNLLQAKARWL